MLVEEIVRKMDEVFVNEIKNIEGRLKSKRELHFFDVCIYELAQ